MVESRALLFGHRVVVTAHKTDQIDDLKARGEALILPLDVTDRAQAEAAVKGAEEAFKGIDVLVNNTGIGYFAAVEESDEDQVQS
jgi:NADP-dependent 3-hydroxy acid dehydrogenase YdfG